MLPFLTQPAAAPACYVPRAGSVIGQAQVFRGGEALGRQQALGNPGVWWVSMWVRPGAGGNRCLINAYTAPGSRSQTFLRYDGGGGLQFYEEVSGATRVNVAWSGFVFDLAPYHLLLEVNTAAITAADRVKLWKNGISLVGAGDFPSLNAATFFNGGGTGAGTVALGVRGGGSAITSARQEYLNDILSEVMFGDGPGPGVSVIGETNIHGVWVPRPRSEIYAAIAAAGGWGVNGCHLDFANPLNPGHDASGQGNHFTASGFDGSGKDTLVNTPTNVFSTFNPLDAYGPPVFSNGALTLTTAVAANYKSRSTLPLPGTGKWYAEARNGSACTAAVSSAFGLCSTASNMAADTISIGSQTTGLWFMVGVASTVIRDQSVTISSSLPALAAGDDIQIAYDADSNCAWVGRNDVWYDGAGGTTGNPATGANPTFSGLPKGLRVWGDVWANSLTANFGQRPFTRTQPAGYKTLCTDNLPEPDIKDPAEGYAAAIAAGANITAVLNASTAHWNGAAYVEIVKRRDGAEDWRVRFSDDPANAWATNNVNAKAVAPALVAGGSYVGYRLRVGTKYGVYTAEVAHVAGAPTTVAHGLASICNAVIVTRVSVGGGDRYFRHPDLPSGQLLKLNSNAAAASDGTLTGIGSNSFQIAAAAPSGTYRVVVLAQRDGYLDLGKYTGNGATDGAFTAMTVAPLLVIGKAMNGIAGGIGVMDAARDPINPVSALLSLDSPAAEATGTAQADMVVGGLKLRATTAAINTSGATYCTIAIGRPIGGICVAPATAR